MRHLNQVVRCLKAEIEYFLCHSVFQTMLGRFGDVV